MATSSPLARGVSIWVIPGLKARHFVFFILDTVQTFLRRPFRSSSKLRSTDAIGLAARHWLNLLTGAGCTTRSAARLRASSTLGSTLSTKVKAPGAAAPI